MNALRLLPVWLAFWLMAAHAWRAGWAVVAAGVLVAPLLTLARRRWVPPLFQAALLLFAAEWLRTLAVIASMRIEFGLPWLRMALILGAVALLTAASALVFRSPALRARYASRPASPEHGSIEARKETN